MIVQVSLQYASLVSLHKNYYFISFFFCCENLSKFNYYKFALQTGYVMHAKDCVFLNLKHIRDTEIVSSPG